MIKHNIAIFLAILFATRPIVAQTVYYEVMRGDTLSEILHSKGLRPIYGKDGALAHTLEMNPSLQESDGDLILSGQRILLSSTSPSKREKIKITSSLEEKEPSSPEKNIIQASSDKLMKHASLSLSFGTGLVGVNAEDEKGDRGRTQTQSYYFTELSFKQNWSDLALTSSFNIGFHQFTLASPEGAKHANESFSVPSMGVDFEKSYGESGSLLFGINYDPIFYVYSRAEDEISNDASMLGNLHLGVGKEIMNEKKLTSSLKLKAIGIIPQRNSNVNFKSGWGAETGIQNVYRSGEWSLNGNINLGMKFIETDLGELEQTDVNLSIGVTNLFD